VLRAGLLRLVIAVGARKYAVMESRPAVRNAPTSASCVRPAISLVEELSREVTLSPWKKGSGLWKPK